MGLNDLTQKGRLEWVSTHEGEEIPYSYNNFGVDADLHDASRRCTFSLFSNNLPQDRIHVLLEECCVLYQGSTWIPDTGLWS